MPNERDKQSKYTFWTVVIGIIVLLVMYSIAIYVFKSASNPAESIVAVLGAVTGVLGTLVGYTVGQTGKEKAERHASQAEQKLAAVVDSCEVGIMHKAKAAYPDLFK